MKKTSLPIDNTCAAFRKKTQQKLGGKKKYRSAQKCTTKTRNTPKYRNALQKQNTQTNIEMCCKNGKTRNMTKYRNMMQKQKNNSIQKTQPNTEMCCKYTKNNWIQKHAANT